MWFNTFIEHERKEINRHPVTQFLLHLTIIIISKIFVNNLIELSQLDYCTVAISGDIQIRTVQVSVISSSFIINLAFLLQLYIVKDNSSRYKNIFHWIRNDGHSIVNSKFKSASIYYVIQHGIENLLFESWAYHCFINIASNCRFWTYL